MELMWTFCLNFSFFQASAVRVDIIWRSSSDNVTDTPDNLQRGVHNKSPCGDEV